MMLSGIFFYIRYEKKLDSRAAYVFCPNHTSNLDIPLMCLVAHGTFHFMGKEELVRNPLFRLFFRTIDISVTRDSKLSGYRALPRARENLRHGMSLVLFPWGPITAAPPRQLPFTTGFFALAF